MSVKMTTKIAEQFEGYPIASVINEHKIEGPYLKTVRSDKVVNRQHVQLYDKNGNVTYVMGTYQTGGGSGYKLVLYTAFECITDEIEQDMIIIFDYPSEHAQTPAFKKAERALKKIVRGYKNVKVMNWQQFEKWTARWQNKNKSIPQTKAKIKIA